MTARRGLQLRSLLKKSGELELSLVNIPTPEPADDEVVVRVEADADQPVRPRAADRPGRHVDREGLRHEGRSGGHRKMPEAAMRMMGGRLDQSLPVGNEGAGVVIRPAPRTQRKR